MFTIQPIDNTPSEDQGFPRYIQFQQWNGVNLGGPDATTVNFTGGLKRRREHRAASTTTP